MTRLVIYDLSEAVGNGQVLSTAHISFCGAWNAHLRYTEDDDVPTSLCCHGIGVILLVWSF